ncbi:hypothetical protein C8F04DRAFT_331018 [Mycena alexandri]|uniref:Uncharacterized protein n=1 Tax=Mycena alexandri TaxID=1745969 RepID=A0AAD6T7Q7_9AGAR|nr:hypothetical protein C8F04DRAFT_331018 [Mycena alexandri]
MSHPFAHGNWLRAVSVCNIILSGGSALFATYHPHDDPLPTFRKYFCRSRALNLLEISHRSPIMTAFIWGLL